MKRFKYSILAAAGVLILALIITAIGPKRVMAALGYTPVRDVDNPGRHPFQIGLASFNSFRFTVPAGKRLVIENVSGNAFSFGVFRWVGLLSTAGGAFTSHLIPVTSAGLAGSGANTYTFGQVTTIYADPETDVFCNGSDDGLGFVAVSGHLVDLPRSEERRVGKECRL